MRRSDVQIRSGTHTFAVRPRRILVLRVHPPLEGSGPITPIPEREWGRNADQRDFIHELSLSQG